MFDPAIDKPELEWCYAAKSTTVIGKPFVPEPVQITYDGAIYTRYAELAFFYGLKLTPVMARNKTFRDGWIPVIEYRWHDGSITYDLEIFSAELPDMGINNLVQFASLTMTNTGKKPATGLIAAAMRGSAAHFRKGKPKKPVKPTTKYEITNNRMTRDGQLIYAASPGGRSYAVPGIEYRGPYTAADHHISDRVATGFSVYRRDLKPGEHFKAIFKMPRIPVARPDRLAAIEKADYQKKLGETIKYWEDLFGDYRFVIPEKRVQDSARAALVHLILATRGNAGKGKRQGSGLPYDALFLNDYMDMLLAYDTAGMFKMAAPNVAWLLRKQYKSGMFIDVQNRGNDNIVTSHGQALYALAYHYIMTRDKTYAAKVYPAVRRGVEFIINDHRNDKHGLLRPSIPYDAPMVTGYHTCHNLFALAAMRASIRMARMLGENTDAKAWTTVHESYEKAIIKAIDDIIAKEGYIRSGLYDWKAGWVQGRKGHVNEFPNQDWENNLLVYPTELLKPGDKRVSLTLAEIRRRKYREGVMTYRNGMHIHQYITINQAHQYMAIGDQEHALRDFYHVLLHNGSTHEGFENLVDPWSIRTPSPGCPPPHAWAAAKTALFIRNMMIREYGGKMGMDMTQRDIHLYSLIAPNWVKPGQKLEIHNAPTEFGKVSSTLTFSANGATMTVKPAFHTKPRYIALRIPTFVKLNSFKTDAAKSFEKDGILYFTPDVKRVTIQWSSIPVANAYHEILNGYRSEYNYIVKDDNYDPKLAGKPFLLDDEKADPGGPLSFELVRRAFLKEYKRRFDEYVGKGGKPYAVEAPSLLSAAQRQSRYKKTFKIK